MEEGISLVNLVVARLQEEYPDYVIASSYMSWPQYTYHDVYVNSINMCEVFPTEVRMWLPPAHATDVSERAVYQAADPKFFIHIVGTVKLIIQRYNEAVENGKYFNY